MNLSVVESFAAHQCGPEASLYLLLDPLADCARDDPLHLDALRDELGEQALTRLPRPDLRHAPASCPVLVTLAGPGAAPAQRLLQDSALRAGEDAPGQRRYICGWLSSSADAEAVCRHLINLCQLAAREGGRFCPVYEPLRLELFAGTYLPDGPMPWWPVQGWLFAASSGAHFVLDADQPGDAQVADFAFSMQEDTALVARLLRMWGVALQGDWPYSPTRWRGTTALPTYAAYDAFAQIMQARQLGLRQPDEILTLALHQLVFHTLLHRHQRVRRVLGPVIEGHHSLRAAFDTFRDRDWNQIISELPGGAA